MDTIDLLLAMNPEPKRETVEAKMSEGAALWFCWTFDIPRAALDSPEGLSDLEFVKLVVRGILPRDVLHTRIATHLAQIGVTEETMRLR